MKNAIGRVAFIFGLVLAAFSGFCQDNHFTLYSNLPLALNPALTGTIDGDMRAGILYRNQWRVVGKPYNTVNAYADKKFVFKRFNVGLGLSVLNDHSGPAGLNAVKIFPAGSFGLKFGKHDLIIGVEPGMVHKSMQESLFPNQYDPTTGTYTSSLPSGESADIYKKFYFDMNAGLAYKLRMKHGHIQVGESFHHLTSPNESLLSGTDKLSIRYTTHADYLRWIKTKTFVTASGSFMFHGKATEMNLSTVAGYTILSEDKKTIVARLGIAYRNNISHVNEIFFGSSDAVSILSGFSWNKIDVDFAYDVNVSSLSEDAKNAGAFEIALTYKRGTPQIKDKIKVPCRRY